MIGVWVQGPVFWVCDTVPAGFDTYCNTTLTDSYDIGSDASRDAADFRAKLVSTTPSVDAGEPNERSVYALPHPSAGKSGAGAGQPLPLELVLLLRTGNTTAPVLWASRCTLIGQGNGTNAHATSTIVRRESTMGVGRPGTGIYNYGLPEATADGDFVYSGAPSADADADAKGLLGLDRTCDWSVPEPTNMPDSHTRTCAGTFPDGRRWLLGSQLPQTGLRTPLTLATSKDGLDWYAPVHPTPSLSLSLWTANLVCHCPHCPKSCTPLISARTPER